MACRDALKEPQRSTPILDSVCVKQEAEAVAADSNWFIEKDQLKVEVIAVARVLTGKPENP